MYSDGLAGSTKPALRRLDSDISQLIEGTDEIAGLEGGFDTRADIIRWEQRLVTRTIGEVPTFFLQGLASQLASPRDRPLVQALLSDSDLAEETASWFRDRTHTKIVAPSFERAYRKLRVNTTEYTDDVVDDSQKDGCILLRPSIEQRSQRQKEALEPVLGDGFDSADEIRKWAHTLTHASYGEPIQLPDGDTIAVSAFVAKMHRRDAWREMLLDPEMHRPRQIWAARFLIPTFNAAARAEFGTSTEVLDLEDEVGSKGATVDV